MIFHGETCFVLLVWKQSPISQLFGYRQKNGWDGDSLMANKLLRNSEYYLYYLFAKINYASTRFAASFLFPSVISKLKRLIGT